MLVTPQSHRIHHSSDPRHRDKNFGVIFSFWNRLFGTAFTGADEYPETGIQDEDFPLEHSVRGVLFNYFEQFVYPLRQLARRVRRHGGA